MTIKFLNTILLKTGNDFQVFWLGELPNQLNKQFYSIFKDNPEEEKHLKSLINMSMLFERIQELTGIIFENYVFSNLKLNILDFEIVYPDIKKIQSIVKAMPLIEEAEGLSLSIQANTKKGKESDRLFLLSKEKFLNALQLFSF